jgi:DNA polymerase III delta prime subunit
VSLEGGKKYLILDEADYLNPQSTQPALRGFIEEFHKNCGFILTCNYKNRIIPALQSRCSVIDFVIPKAEKNKLATQFFNRSIQILNENEIKFNEKVVAELINTYFPDWRKVLNELQRYSVAGEIDAGILVNLGDKNIKDLMGMMKNKEFTNVRKWVVDSLDNDSDKLFRAVYDNLYEYVDPSSIPHVVVALGEYQFKAAFVADLEINMMACLTEIMGGAKFK